MRRILQSAGFRNAHTLQHLLDFLVAQAYGPDAETLKESTIGVGVFNRPANFDPKADPVVRVQVHRLRQKLQEYYETDGRHDPILIDIPKGTYVPVFEEIADHSPAVNGPSLTALEAKGVRDESASTQTSESHETQAVAEKSWRSGKLFFGTLFAVAMVMVVFALGFWFGKGQLRGGTDGDPASAVTDLALNRTTDPVKAFWISLLGDDPAPIIAHADAVFLLDSNSDLFWFPHGESDYRGAPVDPGLARQFAANPALVARAGKLYYEDVYLGSGDLDAVGILANLFGEIGRKPRIVAGRDLTPADLQQHNVILVGSSFQSYAVAQFNTMGDFSFKSSHSLEKDWSGMIENARPRPGEARIYRTERDPVTRVVKLDHALITVEPGIIPGRYIADFGGLDTTGSEGAALFATSRAGVDELSKAFTTQGIRGANGGPPLFQALLSVRLEKGHEVLGSSLVAVHPLLYNRSEGTTAESANTSTR